MAGIELKKRGRGRAYARRDVPKEPKPPPKKYNVPHPTI